MLEEISRDDHFGFIHDDLLTTSLQDVKNLRSTLRVYYERSRSLRTQANILVRSCTDRATILLAEKEKIHTQKEAALRSSRIKPVETDFETNYLDDSSALSSISVSESESESDNYNYTPRSDIISNESASDMSSKSSRSSVVSSSVDSECLSREEYTHTGDVDATRVWFD